MPAERSRAGSNSSDTPPDETVPDISNLGYWDRFDAQAHPDLAAKFVRSPVRDVGGRVIDGLRDWLR